MNELTKSVVKLKSQAVRVIHNNSPAILAAVGVSGTLTTAYLSGKASFRAAKIIARAERTQDLSTKEKVEMVWKFYIPAGVSAGLTVTSIIAGTTIGTRRTAAVASLYSVTDKAFSEYKEKVTETIGEKKEQRIHEQIAQDGLNTNPPADNILMLTEPGTVLFREHFTGRDFHSDMETIRRAENDINSKIHNETYATLSDFYDLVGLPHTSMSDETGWDLDKKLEIRYSAVLLPGGKPCVSFEYNYAKLL
jgi:hypothetical protein